MGQKYRADYSQAQDDGTVLWFTKWMGGPTLAKIGNCPIHETDLRLMVYATAEPDTYFSQPACTRHKGRHIRGYLTCEDNHWSFHVMDVHRHLVGLPNKTEGQA